MRRPFNVFQSQVLTKNQEDAIIRNNMAIDISFGHDALIAEFPQRHPEFTPHLEYLHSLSEEDVPAYMSLARKNSLFMTVIMLTGNCNANCEVCYTNRQMKSRSLSAVEIRSVLDQTSALGSRLVYIPGEGEPTLDNAFWDFLEHAVRLRMEVIVFTNGILLSNDSQALQRWGITSDEFVRRLAKYPVYVYHKLWSLQPDKHTTLMGIPVSSYDWTEISIDNHRYTVPSGLVRMIECFPRYRVGVQVIAERRNYKEISHHIIPFIQGLHLRSYIEPVLHSGRMRGRTDLDLGEDELRSLNGWISRTTCRRIAYKIVVHNDGTLSPGMGFNPNELDCDFRRDKYSIRDEGGKIRDIFSLIHDDAFFVWARYQIDGCLCEKVNRWIAGYEPQPHFIPIKICRSSDSIHGISGTFPPGL